MELFLDRSLAARRIYPAINLEKSSTRHDELLLSKKAFNVEEMIRRSSLKNNVAEDTANVIQTLQSTSSNNVLINALAAQMEKKKEK